MLFFLLYRVSKVYLTRQLGVITPRFTFAKGGKLSIKIGATSSERFYVGLFSIKQHDTVRKAISASKNLCETNLSSAQTILFERDPNQTSTEITITVPDAGTYFTGISSCDANISDFTLTASFSNPKSLLSQDEQPVIIIKGVTAIIYAVFLISWFIIRAKARPLLSPFWIIITITCSLLVASRLFSCLSLYFATKKDLPFAVSYIDNLFNFLTDGILFFTFAIAPIGLPHSIKSPRFRYILYAVVSTVLMAFPIFLVGKGRHVGHELWINIFSTVWIYLCFLASFALISSSFVPLQRRSEFYHMKPEAFDLTGTRSNLPMAIDNTPARLALLKQFWHINARILVWGFMYFCLLTWTVIPYPPNKACWLSCLILDTSCIICYMMEFLITVLTKEEDDFFRADEPDQPDTNLDGEMLSGSQATPMSSINSTEAETSTTETDPRPDQNMQPSGISASLPTI